MDKSRFVIGVSNSKTRGALSNYPSSVTDVKSLSLSFLKAAGIASSCIYIQELQILHATLCLRLLYLPFEIYK